MDGELGSHPHRELSHLWDHNHRLRGVLALEEGGDALAQEPLGGPVGDRDGRPSRPSHYLLITY